MQCLQYFHSNVVFNLNIARLKSLWLLVLLLGVSASVNAHTQAHFKLYQRSGEYLLVAQKPIVLISGEIVTPVFMPEQSDSLYLYAPGQAYDRLEKVKDAHWVFLKDKSRTITLDGSWSLVTDNAYKLDADGDGKQDDIVFFTNNSRYQRVAINAFDQNDRGYMSRMDLGVSVSDVHTHGGALRFKPDQGRDITIRFDANTASYIQETTPLPAQIGSVGGPSSDVATVGRSSLNRHMHLKYALDIATPKISGRLSPKLSATHVTESPVGILGNGWHLAGLSSVSRCNTDKNTRSGLGKWRVSYSHRDTLCLDGIPLIRQGGRVERSVIDDYWKDGSRYLLKSDHLTEVVASNAMNELTVSKKGDTWRYKKTNEMRWDLSQYTNKYGESIYYDYHRHNALSPFSLPSAIRYGDYRVDFKYDLSASDNVLSLQHTKYKRNILLTSVSVRHAHQIIHRYQYSYELSDNKQHYRMSKAQACSYKGGRAHCAHPITFQWDDWFKRTGIRHVETSRMTSNRTYGDGKILERSMYLDADINDDYIKERFRIDHVRDKNSGEIKTHVVNLETYKEALSFEGYIVKSRVMDNGQAYLVAVSEQRSVRPSPLGRQCGTYHGNCPSGESCKINLSMTGLVVNGHKRPDVYSGYCIANRTITPKDINVKVKYGLFSLKDEISRSYSNSSISYSGTAFHGSLENYENFSKWFAGFAISDLNSDGQPEVIASEFDEGKSYRTYQITEMGTLSSASMSNKTSYAVRNAQGGLKRRVSFSDFGLSVNTTVNKESRFNDLSVRVENGKKSIEFNGYPLDSAMPKYDWKMSKKAWFALDYNADGVQDYFFLKKHVNYQKIWPFYNHKVVYYIPTLKLGGSSCSQKCELSMIGSMGDAEIFSALDYDGDGVDELVVWNKKTGEVTIRRIAILPNHTFKLGEPLFSRHYRNAQLESVSLSKEIGGGRKNLIFNVSYRGTDNSGKPEYRSQQSRRPFYKLTEQITHATSKDYQARFYYGSFVQNYKYKYYNEKGITTNTYATHRVSQGHNLFVSGMTETRFGQKIRDERYQMVHPVADFKNRKLLGFMRIDTYDQIGQVVTSNEYKLSDDIHNGFLFKKTIRKNCQIQRPYSRYVNFKHCSDAYVDYRSTLTYNVTTAYGRVDARLVNYESVDGHINGKRIYQRVSSQYKNGLLQTRSTRDDPRGYNEKLEIFTYDPNHKGKVIQKRVVESSNTGDDNYRHIVERYQYSNWVLREQTTAELTPQSRTTYTTDALIDLASSNVLQTIKKKYTYNGAQRIAESVEGNSAGELSVKREKRFGDFMNGYPRSITQTVGQRSLTQRRQYSLEAGALIRQVDPSGQYRQQDYDAFGRLVGESTSDGQYTAISYHPCAISNVCAPWPAAKRYVKTVGNQGQTGFSLQVFDASDRVVGTLKQLADGRYSISRQDFLANGDIHKQYANRLCSNLPCANDWSKTAYTEYEYTKGNGFRSEVFSLSYRITKRKHYDIDRTTSLPILKSLSVLQAGAGRHRLVSCSLVNQFDGTKASNLFSVFNQEAKLNALLTETDAQQLYNRCNADTALDANLTMTSYRAGKPSYVQHSYGISSEQYYYEYHPSGGISSIANHLPRAVNKKVFYAAQYDAFGRLKKETDRERPAQLFRYDAFGQLRSISKQADGQALLAESYDYDDIGRLSAKTTSGVHYTYHYDTCQAGQLCRIKNNDSSYEERFSYNAKGQRIGETYTLPSAVAQQPNLSMHFTSTYDAFGRLSSYQYPQSTKLQMEYQNGHMHRITEHNNPNVLWQGKVMSAQGQWLHSGLNQDRFQNLRSVDQYGQLTSDATLIHGQVNQKARSDVYGFSGDGNVAFHYNTLLSGPSRFQYNNRDALTSTTAPAELNFPAPNAATGYSCGSQLSKLPSNVSSQFYSRSRYNHIQGNSASCYDRFGRQIATLNRYKAQPERIIRYNGNDQPLHVQKGNSALSFAYGPSRQRYQSTLSQQGQQHTRYYSPNGKLEIMEQPNGNRVYRLHIGRFLVIDTKPDGTLIERLWTLRDRTGSIDTVLSDTPKTANGQQVSDYLIGRYHYSPYGLRKASNTALTQRQLRGFTGHEHLDAVGLIHMNGRIYDPRQQRFLSPDPVADLSNPQSFKNRIAYAMNNPLRYTDPSGYELKQVNDYHLSNMVVQTQLNHQMVQNLLTINPSVNVISDAMANNAALKISTAEPSSYAQAVAPSGKSGVGQKADEPSVLGFIKEEGVNVLFRTGQAAGGAGQVLLGGVICYGSGGLACAAGALIAAKGVDNFQAGIRGTDSISQQLLVDVTGSKKAGTLINAGLDLVTSVTGLVRSVPKISAYGTPYNASWYKGVPGYFEPSYRQATTTTLMIEGATATTSIIDAVD